MIQHARVLIADDESSIRFFLRETLESAGHEVVEVETGDAALEALSGEPFAIAFLDVRMPGLTGIELLDQIQALGSDVAAVIITAQNTLENAVEAMKRGALDYLVKPFGMDEVLALVEKALRTRALQIEVRDLRREVGRTPVVGERLVGSSPEMLEVFKTIGRVARSDVPVLITGESGTGKELVARAIHQASPRGEAPFVAVNAAAIPRDLLESELFGHERGAFTGATESRPGRFREARGGTLFLDEIGDMPPELQAKLLRVLQSGEVLSVGGRQPEQLDVRILAATHRDLDAAIRDGSFREDLLYRLRVVPIHIPPLRDRPSDIPTLVHHFVGRYGAEFASGAVDVADRTVDRLAAYEWPGNVRELENAIKRALVLTTADVLTPEAFEFLGSSAPESDGSTLEQRIAQESRAALEESEPRELHRKLLARVEKPLLETVLQHTGGNQLRAASLLGINRNTLRKKLTELEIDVPARG